MIRAELYVKSGRPLVVIDKLDGCNTGSWARILEVLNRGIVDGSARRADVRADVFLAEIAVFREVRTLFHEQVVFGSTLSDQVRKLVSDRHTREASLARRDSLDIDSVEQELKDTGFTRQLKSFQLQNLATLLLLPHGADFSVPGAGKTTVALANFAIQKQRGNAKRMLVIGPIAAFEAWKTDTIDCFSAPLKVTVHRGLESVIPDDTDILLTNYNRVAIDYDRIRQYVAAQPCMVILDEAHRIKRGADGVHGRAVLDLAYAAHRRDVLTGTPAPQGASDLIAIMRFLYPGQDNQILPAVAYNAKEGRNPTVLSATSKAIARYFVRTTKSSLDLPETKFNVIRRPMGPLQDAIYEALLGRYRGIFELDRGSRRELDRIGRIVMYLLEAATNPMLLAAGSDHSDAREFQHPPLELSGNERLMDLLQEYHLHEKPWKYQVLADIAAQSAIKGEKIIVWSSFVRNLKILSRELSDLQPAIIHGGIPSENVGGSTGVTREDELRRFRSDPNCFILLANPAACGEGISLHHWCHHAVYLDATFNAGQFLQSQDRIHRLGLSQQTITQFTLLQSAGSIDDTVGGRLREKVRSLALLMDDPGLVRCSLPAADEGESGPPILIDDLAAALAHIKQPSSRAP